MSIINKRDESQSLTKAVENTINQLQQGGGGRIKVKRTITETLTLEVSGQKNEPVNKRDHEWTEDNLTVYSEPLPIGESSKLGEAVKVNQGAENSSQEAKKEVEIPVNLETINSNNSSNDESSGSEN